MWWFLLGIVALVVLFVCWCYCVVAGRADDRAERLLADLELWPLGMPAPAPRPAPLRCVECGIIFAHDEIGIYSETRRGFRCTDCDIGRALNAMRESFVAKIDEEMVRAWNGGDRR